jgi:Glycosyl transferase family 2
MSPLVSVIIPCKNGAAWLGDAIESCLGQTWDNLEVIIVDNGSSDASVEVAQRYQSAAVALHECERDGASAARNVGLEKAQGDLIQFLDADDILDRGKIRLQVERLALAPRLSVASAAWARFQHSPDEAKFSTEPIWRDLRPEEFLISSWLGGGMMPIFAWLTPRAAIEKAGPWNERLSLGDDGEFFCRVVLASSGVVFCKEARGYYRTVADQTISKRRDRKALASSFETVELSCARLQERCSLALTAKACATQYQRFIYDAYPAVPDLVEAAEQRVAEFGGSDLRIGGGRAFQIILYCFGWKFAKRCHLAWRKLKTLAASVETSPRRIGAPLSGDRQTAFNGPTPKERQ